jgi:N-acetylglucosaminyldiphosphoundecaprenol N-acetyl-beta-D-mannosaminyltransferase
MPKQELWMHRMSEQLPGVALAGVGAAFDFLAGTVEEAPAWIQSAGLEWLYRLAREPRRLWRRYVWNNPAFVFLVMQQILQLRLTGASERAEASDGSGTDG